MEVLDAIRLAHRIDQDLGRMSTAVGEEFRDRVQRIQTEWREVAYAVSANLCGVDVTGDTGAAPRRGRPRKKAEDGACGLDPRSETSSSASGGGG